MSLILLFTGSAILSWGIRVLIKEVTTVMWYQFVQQVHGLSGHGLEERQQLATSVYCYAINCIAPSAEANGRKRLKVIVFKVEWLYCHPQEEGHRSALYVMHRCTQLSSHNTDRETKKKITITSMKIVKTPRIRISW